MPGFAEALDTAIVRLTDEFTDLTEDSLDLGEVFAFFFSCAGELATLGQQYLDTPDVEKRRLILAALRRIYKRHNPDIPLVPEPFETLLEHLLLQQVLPAVYDFVVKRV